MHKKPPPLFFFPPFSSQLLTRCSYSVRDNLIPGTMGLTGNRIKHEARSDVKLGAARLSSVNREQYYI